jgi:hypothetical protein
MKTIDGIVGRSVFSAGCALISLLFFAEIAFSQTTLPKTPGVWISRDAQYKLSGKRQEQLTQSLRRITGLHELNFTEDGALVAGDVSSEAEGSTTARQILSCSLGSGDVFVIEDHSDSLSVNFGQLDEGLRYEDAMTGARMVIWRVRLDFNDFRAMQAPREVRESFDVGFTMLHELSHGLGFKDAATIDELGECEELLNQARTELRLPLRDQYFGDALQIGRNFVSIRLRFRSKSPGALTTASRDRMQYLFFIAPPDPDEHPGIAVFNCAKKR